MKTGRHVRQLEAEQTLREEQSDSQDEAVGTSTVMVREECEP